MSKIFECFLDKAKTIVGYPKTLTKAIYDVDGNRLDNMLNAIKTEMDLNSDIWSSTTVYAVGAYVIHNNRLYKCKIQNIGQNPSTQTSYWEATSTTKEFEKLSSIKKDLSNIIKKDGSLTLTANNNTNLDINIDNGYYLVTFMYAFEANTQGQITLGSMVQAGYATNINNYVQLTGLVNVTSGILRLYLFSTSAQSNRTWKLDAIKLS